MAHDRKSEKDLTGSRDAAAPLPGGAPEPAGIHRLLVDSVGDYAIFAMDSTGHILTWNKGGERLKGYRADEIIGKHFSIFYPPEAIAINHPQRELAIADAEGRYEEEGWRVRKDGTLFWANIVITALRGENDQLIGFAKVTRDLTDRKRAEERLRQSEERFRLVVQSVRDYGIFMLDPSGHVISWNAGAEQIKGYTEKQILGKHFSVFYPEEDLLAGKPAMELRVAEAEGRFEDEGWRLRRDGTRFWANVVITPLHNGAGTLVGFAKVTRDLTERREAEQRALADARRVAEAEAANRTKSEFLAAMSHELRTPLNAIGGYADLIALGIHGPVTDDQRQSLMRIRAAQHHLLGLISDLLNFSRIEAGRIVYDHDDVVLAQVAEAVTPMIEPQAAVKQITIKWQPPDPDVVAYADKRKVEQILLNLLTNAVKFTVANGSIEVRHFVDGDNAALQVIDTGVGIPPENLDAIFEPFVQVGRTLTSPQEGSGLGLAISRDLARAMHGDLTVQSELGKGSVFTLTLPRTAAIAEKRKLENPIGE